MNCIRQSDGATVGRDYCSEVLNAVMVSQVCNRECPLDCVLGKPTRWSTCSSGCDQQAIRHRHVAIVSQGNEYGRQCPDPKLLHQVIFQLRFGFIVAMFFYFMWSRRTALYNYVFISVKKQFSNVFSINSNYEK